MKVQKIKKSDISQSGICESHQPSVLARESSLFRSLCEQKTEIKDSIDKLGVVLEFFAEMLTLNDNAIVEYVKNFVQDDVYLLTNIAKANRCFRDILFLIEEGEIL